MHYFFCDGYLNSEVDSPRYLGRVTWPCPSPYSLVTRRCYSRGRCYRSFLGLYQSVPFLPQPCSYRTYRSRRARRWTCDWRQRWGSLVGGRKNRRYYIAATLSIRVHGGYYWSSLLSRRWVLTNCILSLYWQRRYGCWVQAQNFGLYRGWCCPRLSTETPCACGSPRGPRRSRP